MSKYPVAYLIGWIEGEIEQAEEDGAKDRFIEIHRAIIERLRIADSVLETLNTMLITHRQQLAKIKAGDALLIIAKKARPIISIYCQDHLRAYDKAIKDYKEA